MTIKRALLFFISTYYFFSSILRFLTKTGRQVCINLDLGTLEDCTWQTNGRKWMMTCFQFLHNKNNHMLLIGKTTFFYTQQNNYSCMVLRNQFRGGRGLDRMVVKSPKQTYCFCSVSYYYYSSLSPFFPRTMNLSTADLRNYWTEFHETWWSYRYMFLVGPKVFSFVVKGVKVIFWGVQRWWGLL